MKRRKFLKYHEEKLLNSGVSKESLVSYITPLLKDLPQYHNDDNTTNAEHNTLGGVLLNQDMDMYKTLVFLYDVVGQRGFKTILKSV